MRLAVLGSLPMAVVNAAWGAATSKTEVIYASQHTEPGIQVTNVSWDGRTRPGRVIRARLGAAIAADAYLLIATRDETLELTRRYASFMQGRPVLLAPGGFAIVEAVDKILQCSARRSPVGQVPGFPVTGDISGDEVQIRSVKQQLPIGPLDLEDSGLLVEVFIRWFPDLVTSSLVKTTLSNTNNILHPPILLMNAARTEAGEDYLFYRQDLSAGAAELVTSIDRERLEILRGLNQDGVPLTGWYTRYYAGQGLVGETIGEMILSRSSLAGSRGPKTLDYRYVTEDVMYGLAPMEELARRIDVPTPVLTSLITILSVICQDDLREAASRLVDESALPTYALSLQNASD